MASIKSLLQATVKQGARFAFPEFNNTGAITYPLVAGAQKITAPDDGFMCAVVNGTNPTIELYVLKLQILSKNSGGTWARAFIPVRKGQNVGISVWSDQLITAEAYFIPCQGRN